MNKPLKKFIVTKEHTGHDNNWNQPKTVFLKVGDVLTATDYNCGNRASLFFSINGDKNNCVCPSSYKSRHPYDEGVYDYDFLEEITEGYDLRHIKSEPLKALLRDEQTVRCTKELVYLHAALKATKELAIAERSLTGNDISWLNACRHKFFTSYCTPIAKIGLRQNEQTFNALIRCPMPDEIESTPFEELPLKFAFNPWAGNGQGGFISIPQKQ